MPWHDKLIELNLKTPMPKPQGMEAAVGIVVPALRMGTWGSDVVHVGSPL